MLRKKLFLASSAELKEDRREFEIFINRKNKDWVGKGVFLELVVWEDFLDAVSQTRLQDEYNRRIRECDLFVMLFFTKVGQYTEEEFETAFGQFKATNKPFIFTYFKDAEISIASVNESDLMSLLAFKKKLAALGHFYTTYKNTEGLLLHFTQQLDKLVTNGFIEFKPENCDTGGGNTNNANLTGSGVIAQGTRATAVGAGGVSIGGKNTGSINTGTQVDTDGGAYIHGNVNAGGDFVGRDKITQGVSPRDLESLFAPLLATVADEASADKKASAVEQVQELKAEVAKGKQADDGKMAKLVDGLVGLVPKAVGAVVSAFGSPILGGIAGPVTKFVLDKLQGR
jgi:hypothetical protein